MEQATLLDLPDIYEILEEYLSDEELLAIRQIFSLSKVYLSEEKDMVIFFTPVDEGVWSLHFYKAIDSRVNIMNFAMDAHREIIKSTPDLQAVMNIVSKGDRHLRILMGKFPVIDRVAEFPNGDTMWLSTRDKMEAYIRRN